MRVVIMGCGRVGSRLAMLLDQEGHQVTVIDINSDSFRRLGRDFKGQAMVGNGIDQDVLRKAGIEEADAFVVVTQGDNRNVMAAQIAKHIFHVPKVVVRIYDPIREEMYHQLGLDTYSPTKVAAESLRQQLLGEGEKK
ncbi:MAG: TrkA family potassium uptake protein [Chloroflexi bacterium]|nr:TrkA family potassium uptake protein [Chloroflexota bacterium]